MIRGGNIGAMDTELVIQYPTKTRDSVTNEQLENTWTDFATVWGEKIKDPQSREKFEGDQAVSIQTYSFRIRYLSGLTEEMRVKRGTEINYINGIEELDRQKFLIVRTEKRDNG